MPMSYKVVKESGHNDVSLRPVLGLGAMYISSALVPGMSNVFLRNVDIFPGRFVCPRRNRCMATGQ